MDDNLNEFLQQTSDKFLYEMLVSIFQRVFPEDTIFLPMLKLTKKYGMPVKNIIPFITELGEWSKEHLNYPDTISDDDRHALSDLLSRSGFMTIGFDPSDRGDDDEKH